MNELMSLVDDNLLKTESRDSYFVLSPIQFEKLKQICEAVFKLANETLLEIVNQNEVESWIESRYGVVKSLWKNGQTGIHLARIDFAWDQQKNFKVLELNTGSGSGWIRSSLTKKVASADKIGIPLAPPPTFYANYVLYKLGLKIAIIITEAVPECDFVARQIECLGGEAKVIYLSEVGVKDIIDFAPTGLLRRSHAGLVDHSELILKLSSLRLPQIPSFESMFISADKSFLAVLSDRYTTAVLKAGDSIRGREVVLGKNFNSWEDKLKEIMNSNKEWITQELCYLQNTKDNRYEDISVFVVDGVVQGFMSRISAN
ncbi:hypothetical protein F8M41_017735 [Gigaspora margarita]|uniref:Uncharacterized protein n=1 Tax=Gigaspora margarita TaxID=4874 RepID=A0A8H4AMK1_GIGMA|nr:hypothetical protein F8M41_017735 [Gigaspora margarita]